MNTSARRLKFIRNAGVVSRRRSSFRVAMRIQRLRRATGAKGQAAPLLDESKKGAA